MSRYTQWLKRKENASPYANEAICCRCKHCSWVRFQAFCSGRGRIRRLTEKEMSNTKPCFCPEYEPKEET